MYVAYSGVIKCKLDEGRNEWKYEWTKERKIKLMTDWMDELVEKYWETKINYPNRNVFIFSPPISHILHGTEIRPLPWQTGDYAPKLRQKKLRHWVCCQWFLLPCFMLRTEQIYDKPTVRQRKLPKTAAVFCTSLNSSIIKHVNSSNFSELYYGLDRKSVRRQFILWRTTDYRQTLESKGQSTSQDHQNDSVTELTFTIWGTNWIM
jgi:hypothetical protein